MISERLAHMIKSDVDGQTSLATRHVFMRMQEALVR